jgi:hypothetical protein
LDRIAVLYVTNSRDRDIKLLPSITHSRTQLVNLGVSAPNYFLCDGLTK